MTQRSSPSLWTSVPQGSPAPCNRHKHACCAYKGEIYVLGGREKMTLRDFWKYSVVRNEWTELDCISEWAPEELEGHTLVPHQGTLYVLGGLIDSAYTEWKIPLWMFDTDKESWKYSQNQRQPTQPVPLNRKGHTAVVLGSLMYVYGGYIDLRGSSQELWQYEFESGLWSLLSGVHPELGPGPRHGHAAVAHPSTSSMYLYGGLSGLREQKDLWRWSQDTHSWTQIKTHSGPSKLLGHSLVLYQDSLLLFGGGETHGSPTNALWRLCLSSHTWEKLASVKGCVPPGKIYHCAVGLGQGFQASYSSSVARGLCDSPKGSPLTGGRFRPFKNRLSPAPSPWLEGGIELQTLQLQTADRRALGLRDYQDEEEEVVKQGAEKEDSLKGTCLVFENQDAFQKHWDLEDVSECSEDSLEQHLPEALLVIGGKPLRAHTSQTSISIWQVTL